MREGSLKTKGVKICLHLGSIEILIMAFEEFNRNAGQPYCTSLFMYPPSIAK